MSKKRIELTGADLAYDIMESDITIADMDCEGILTEGVRGDMQGMGGDQYDVADDAHGDPAKENLPMREHQLGQGEVAMTKELCAKLLSAVVAQSPDEGKLEAICQGLVSAGNKEDRTLDVADIGMIMGEIKAANSGGGEDPEGDMAYDQGSEEEPAGEPEGDVEEEETCEGCGQYEDQAEGDKKEPQGGAERHKEKEYQLMDQEGDDDLEEAEGGKPISDQKTKGKGPGGGSADEYGQKASDDIIPEYPDGNDDGVPGKPLDNVTPPPGSGKSGKSVNEAWLAAVPGVFLGSGDPNDPVIDDEDPDAELKMIRRRANIPNWWKV